MPTEVSAAHPSDVGPTSSPPLEPISDEHASDDAGPDTPTPAPASGPRWLTFVLLSIAGLMATDMVEDYRGVDSFGHLAREALVLLLAVGAAVVLLARTRRIEADVRRVRHSARRLATDLDRARADAGRWRSEAEAALAGLATAIDAQFDRWNLTPAEREVGLLLLKGLSLKEIADLRHASERTVRQQATVIYRKSGVAGRAELSAFFLEDLLLPRR